MGLTYVFGMVLPLMVLTAIWDRAHLSERPRFRGRTVRWRLGSMSFVTNAFDLIAAGMFTVMGIVLVVVAITGATVATDFQVGLSAWFQERLRPVVSWLDPVPDIFTGLGLVGIGVAVATASNRRRHAADAPPRRDGNGQGSQETEGQCHGEPQAPDTPAAEAATAHDRGET